MKSGIRLNQRSARNLSVIIAEFPRDGEAHHQIGEGSSWSTAVSDAQVSEKLCSQRTDLSTHTLAEVTEIEDQMRSSIRWVELGVSTSVYFSVFFKALLSGDSPRAGDALSASTRRREGIHNCDVVQSTAVQRSKHTSSKRAIFP